MAQSPSLLANSPLIKSLNSRRQQFEKNPEQAFDRMSPSAVVIPEKLFFKIGEVCELAGVQAHVLRYWESEFPMLAPQKNRAGQRVYRKRDVEIALRIKELLYEDQYTIAGAKKRLANDLRGGKLRTGADAGETHGLSDNHDERVAPRMRAASTRGDKGKIAEDRQTLKQLAAELKEILSLLENENKASASSKK